MAARLAESRRCRTSNRFICHDGAQGNPSDPSYGLPVLDKVQNDIDRVRIGPKRQFIR